MALRRAGLLLLVLLLGAVIVGWIQREQIARDLIGEQLQSLDLPVTYEVSEISPERQVLENIVVGDPDHPDLTIERIEVALVYGFGIPEIGRLTVVKPRLFGSYKDGQLSFGSLDKVLFDDSTEEAGFPALDIEMVDGRGLIESDFGPVGLKLDGQGRLDGGFAGKIAAIAPRLDLPECKIGRTTLYGDLTLETEKIIWSGPIRSANVECPQYAGRVNKLDAQARVTLANDFSKVESSTNLKASGLNLYGIVASGLSGDVNFAVADSRIMSTFDLGASSIASDQFTANAFALDGSLRSGTDLADLELRGSASGEGMTPGADIDSQLASLESASRDTLAAPLLAKLRKAVADEVRSTDFAADFTVRQSGALLSLVVPQGTLKGANGTNLLNLSQLQYSQRANAAPRLSGNFRVGGSNLPKIVGRMEREGGGKSLFRLKMEEYAAADSRIAIPEMLLTQNREGAINFAGQVTATGSLPGGYTRGLRLPLNGEWSRSAGLSVWRNCTNIGFDGLAFANLELNSRNVTICPARGSAIVRQSGAGLQIAAGIAQLDLAGTLAGTPIAIKSGPVGVAYPGIATARQLEIALGPQADASSFVISDVLAKFGDGGGDGGAGDIAGEFSGADISLAAIPLDLKETTGVWTYAGGIFQIDDAAFRLVDRQTEVRFEPLEANGASLTLDDNVVTADATLRVPGLGREVSDVAILHNLSTGTGFADLRVDGLRFDDQLLLDQLTPLALGVVANVEGVVTGTGRIDWNSESVSSSGAFSSESLDFAAAFGPVKGASGTVEFTDLISLTTVPNQSVRVASINPGIEVNDGVIGFNLREGVLLDVVGGEWPFMGGTLRLRPVNLNFGVSESRSYILEVTGLDSALFVESLEIGNLAATGIFDGELPIIFSENGDGRIEGGVLQSRAPGGNVSYVGELTYEDLSAIANYTFATLRSLDYLSMSMQMDGALTGDIITRVRFDGVKQGEGTKQNFITRQIADLPIRLNVNIRAPFYRLISTMKSIYDPSTVKDPRSLGLLVDDGTRFVPSGIDPKIPITNPQQELPEILKPEGPAIKPDELSIQTSDSEEVP
ncbi:hypothetical protein GCM10023115_15040 [Pontixanthobacter gangjinensis]